MVESGDFVKEGERRNVRYNKPFCGEKGGNVRSRGAYLDPGRGEDLSYLSYRREGGKGPPFPSSRAEERREAAVR